DNMGVIDAYKHGHSQNHHTNDSIWCINIITMASNLVFCPVYVNTEDNLADPVSYGALGTWLSHLPQSFELPVELQAYLTYV
ncbi:uncharacterized protein LAESUDRAFT_666426, partial [Laetiporus sulphureus 93-53]